MKITFWGAAEQVTGSMHLLELDNGFKILLDCGLDYEDKDNIIENNREFPFSPPQVDCLILSHAHVDHSGNIPNLVNKGFSGPIYCTPPTADLAWNLLQDSFSIQSRSKKKHQKPPYKQKDITQTFDQMHTLDIGETISISDEVKLTLGIAGHIMGAATVLLEVKDGDGTKKIGFTGDLGKDGSPLIPNPKYFENVDYLISESTYGGRLHASKLSAEEDLKKHIEESLVNNLSRIIIPAFSVGRTQDILFTINKLFASGQLKRCKVFTDSPLAIRSTEVYDKYKDYLNEEANDYYNAGNELFDFEGLVVIKERNSADMVKTIQEPFIVVSAAGMVEGGRIKEHIKNNIQNPSATILIAGYCSKGTLGARLLNGISSIRIEGQDKSVHSFIKKTDAFSAHPDHDGLKKFISNSTGKNTKKVFLVHGDATSSISLKEDIDFVPIEIAIKGQEYHL